MINTNAAIPAAKESNEDVPESAVRKDVLPPTGVGVCSTKSSAELRPVPAAKENPPATRTCPFARRVAVCCCRAAFILAVVLKVSVAGS